MEINELYSGILKGEIRAISKSLTLVESELESDKLKSEILLNKLVPHTGHAIKIGITGIPGVGKSSFIEKIGVAKLNSDKQKKIAVLAIDPSSPLNGGSILGDKTRMEELCVHERVYIRPSPGGTNGGSLGGLARKSRESLIVLDAAGFDYIFIETIGVGQSEYLVASMVDLLLMLQMPCTGDHLQGMKKGLLELAHIISINKADGDLLVPAKLAQNEHLSAVKLLEKNSSSWTVPVLLSSCMENKGFSELWAEIENYISHQNKHGEFSRKRKNQRKNWFEWELGEQLKDQVMQNKEFSKEFLSLKNEMTENKLVPSIAARKLIAKILN